MTMVPFIMCSVSNKNNHGHVTSCAIHVSIYSITILHITFCVQIFYY